MSDDLVERVARALEENSYSGKASTLMLARAAIALVLEEAAKVAEAYDGPGMESTPDAIWGDAQATKDDIAYYIRALAGDEK